MSHSMQDESGLWDERQVANVARVTRVVMLLDVAKQLRGQDLLLAVAAGPEFGQPGAEVLRL